jgi:hypothetical protein
MQKLIAGMVFLALLVGSFAVAHDASGIRKPHARHHHHLVRLPPHHQPRRANAPDSAIGPTAGQKAVDSKIDKICRGC